MTSSAREARAFPTPIEVLSVDGNHAKVIVVGWHITKPVTVPTALLTDTTGLRPDQLPGRWLEATANCHAQCDEDLVLTDIVIAPDLPASWLDFEVPPRPTTDAGFANLPILNLSELRQEQL